MRMVIRVNIVIIMTPNITNVWNDSVSSENKTNMFVLSSFIVKQGIHHSNVLKRSIERYAVPTNNIQTLHTILDILLR